MNKWRYFSLILTIPLTIVLMVLALISEPIWTDLYFVFLVIIFILHFWLSKKEKKKKNEITMVYIENLQPLRYLELFEDFNKTQVISKNIKLMNQITKCQVLLDAGKFQECRNILESLVEEEGKFSPFVRFLYYKNWIHYFGETNDIPRMKFLLDQCYDLLEKIPLKFRQQLAITYKIMEANYFIKEGIFLETAESRYQQIMQTRLPRVAVIQAIFQLAIIDIKSRRLEQAKTRLTSVIKNGRELHLVQKAKKILDEIVEKENLE